MRQLGFTIGHAWIDGFAFLFDGLASADMHTLLCCITHIMGMGRFDGFTLHLMPACACMHCFKSLHESVMSSSAQVRRLTAEEKAQIEVGPQMSSVALYGW